MLDIKFLRQNPNLVRENIKKKFQDEKLPLVDLVISLDADYRTKLQELENNRASMNATAKEIGGYINRGETEKADSAKIRVSELKKSIPKMEEEVRSLELNIRDIMLKIPQIIADDVPLGKDDSENVELERFGDFTKNTVSEIPYHVEVMESFNGLNIDSARKTSGSGFYYLKGDVARVHSAILSYARDFMIERGFEYYVPPIMIRGNVVSGVMSFSEMENMMYKIEGEDLYLIGTSEHSMIGMFTDEIISEENLPLSLTSYSPCFRKEVGAHGIEERGIYRIHQFEKQEMVVICKPEDSPEWFGKLWKTAVDFFLSLDIPVRALECCSGDLADLKVKSVDIEAWSPRLSQFFEVGSCSNLGDAQARRLGIRVRVPGSKSDKYFAHTLNNTVVAPPRALIYFFENNLNPDGSVKIPEPLRIYMGGKAQIFPKK
ncbi:MAG: serine--tRNA ligase [Oscillospiraceae bacterium]|nr:serine--tRNA ligase [Oscillospiraceae bacterium]